MTSPIEERLRSSMARTTGALPPWALAGNAVIRQAVAVRRRRRALIATGAAVAVVAVLLSTTLGSRTQSAPPPVAPTITTTTTPPGPGPVDVVKGNVIYGVNGTTLPIELPAEQDIAEAKRVVGGWMIAFTTLDPAVRYAFVDDQLVVHHVPGDFERALVAVARGGSRVAAYRNGQVEVYDLPSLRRTHLIDVRATLAGAGVLQIWVERDTVVLQSDVARIDNLPAGAFNGAVVINLSRMTVQANPGRRVSDLSPDGSLISLVSPTPAGLDLTGRCMAVAPIVDGVIGEAPTVCDPGINIVRTDFSPDGVWLLATVNSSPAAHEAFFYATEDVIAGIARAHKRDGVPTDARQYPVDWLSATEAVVLDDSTSTYWACTYSHGDCRPLAVPQTPVAIVFDYRVT